MTEWIFFGKCELCPRRRFFIRKRKVPLPINRTAKSQKLMCDHCYKNVLTLLETNKQ